MNYFASNFRKLRTIRGLKQETIAEELDIGDRSTISRWETETQSPDVEKLIKVSEYFGVSLDDLVMKEYEEKTIEDNVQSLHTALDELFAKYKDLKSVENMTIGELSSQTAQRFIEEGHRFVKENNYLEAAKCFEKSGKLGDSDGYYYAMKSYEKLRDRYLKEGEIEEGAWCHDKMEKCEMRMME